MTHAAPPPPPGFLRYSRQLLVLTQVSICVFSALAAFLLRFDSATFPALYRPHLSLRASWSGPS